jgi:hypothetical protein
MVELVQMVKFVSARGDDTNLERSRSVVSSDVCTTARPSNGLDETHLPEN